jgi:RimJ/RimL family protein N-acetyltransferase
MKTYCIREATGDDAKAIHELTIDGIGQWASDIYESLKPWVEATCSPEALATKISSSDYTYFVYVDGNDNVVGTVYLNTKDKYMGGLYCGIKGKGMGTALMNRVFETAFNHELDHVACEIYENNIPSISLMTKLGAVKYQSNPFEGVVYDEYHFSAETYTLRISQTLMHV